LILTGQVDILVNPSLVAPQLEPTELEVINTLWRGQSFGEISLVDEGIRSATARASAINTRLLRISRQDFLHLCNSYPELGYRVMFNLASSIAQTIRHATLQIREALLYKKSHRDKPGEQGNTANPELPAKE
jgi:CRP-like cAMP-binding protein